MYRIKAISTYFIYFTYFRASIGDQGDSMSQEQARRDHDRIAVMLDEAQYPAVLAADSEEIAKDLSDLSRAALYDVIVGFTKLKLPPLPSKLSKASMFEFLARCRKHDGERFDKLIEEESPPASEQEADDEVDDDDYDQEAKVTADKVDKLTEQMALLTKVVADLAASKEATPKKEKAASTLRILRRSEATEKEVLEALDDDSATDVNDEDSCATSIKKKRAVLTKHKDDDEDRHFYAHIAIMMKPETFARELNTTIKDFRVDMKRMTKRDEEDIIVLKDSLKFLVRVAGSVSLAGNAVLMHKLIKVFTQQMEHLILLLLKLTAENTQDICQAWRETMTTQRAKVKAKKVHFLDYGELLRDVKDKAGAKVPKNRGRGRGNFNNRGRGRSRGRGRGRGYHNNSAPEQQQQQQQHQQQAQNAPQPIATRRN